MFFGYTVLALHTYPLGNINSPRLGCRSFHTICVGAASGNNDVRHTFPSCNLIIINIIIIPSCNVIIIVIISMVIKFIVDITFPSCNVIIIVITFPCIVIIIIIIIIMIILSCVAYL